MLSKAISSGALLLVLLPAAACSNYDPGAPSLDTGESPESLTGGGTLIASYNSNIWNGGVAFTSFATPTGWSLDYSQSSQYGYRLRRWTNVNTSKLVTGEFEKVDLAANSWLWGMTSGGGIKKNTYPYAADGGTWQLVCSCNARDLATGADGSVVLIPNDAYDQIWRSTDNGQTWTPITLASGAFKVDVDNNGDIYAIDQSLSVWRLPRGNPNGTWISLGKPFGYGAMEISVGNGRMYVVTTASYPGMDGNYVAKYTVANGWWAGGFLPNVAPFNIHVDVAGRLFGSDGRYQIYRYDNVP